MKRILLASDNPGKVREIEHLLKEMPLMLLTPRLLGLHLEVLEDGRTYAENAAKKAIAYARASGLLTLADDSGLEVEVLGGEPGICSARYAPQPNATDADRRAYLLQRLRNHPRPWLARFCCTIALALPNGELYFTEGVCCGEIIPQERGENGFGYDPIFLLPEQGCTMAELSMEEKNLISHRARAVRAALPLLTRLIARL